MEQMYLTRKNRVNDKLNLMYITNRTDIAQIAEKNGVDWIFIDLEINGKEERQGHLDTVISRHRIDDVKKVKSVLKKSKLLVRVNPIYDESKKEIDRVINDGADIVMLPFFKTKKEVESFIDFVDGRSEICLLLETPEAVNCIDAILDIDGIDYIHIGLNDLHLGYNKKFMFELLVDGTVEMLIEKFNNKDIKYGFGGIARIGDGAISAESIITEHYRLGSSMVILSRSFCNVEKIDIIEKINELFLFGIKEIRNYEKKLKNKPKEFYVKNREELNFNINKIVESM